ncbi:SRPBCC family protein [Sorangium sp. So ce119]|uniref:SRPBCC family protein n=1 Tax=Sorangium sp. So ce119 TaxID=3133279 RepID=UPI003F61C832
MSKKTFTVSHSESTRAPASTVFSIWADVNQWTRWDVGLDACELKNDFQVGSTFKLTPKGSPEPVEAKIQEIVENKKFVDTTELPFGTIKAIHEVKPSEGGSIVTHTIVAEIAEEQAGFFANVIWKGMETGLPDSVKKLAKLAEANS